MESLDCILLRVAFEAVPRPCCCWQEWCCFFVDVIIIEYRDILIKYELHLHVSPAVVVLRCMSLVVQFRCSLKGILEEEVSKASSEPWLLFWFSSQQQTLVYLMAY